MEEFNDMPRERKLFYIASELVEMKNPCRHDTMLRGGGK
jgi:hypothetical protein